MLEIDLLRKDVCGIADRLATRGHKLDVDLFKDLEKRRKHYQILTESFRNKKKVLSEKISRMKGQPDVVSSLTKEADKISQQLERCAFHLERVRKELSDFMLQLPNLPHESVPEGSSAGENKVLRYQGIIRDVDFFSKDHVVLGEELGGFDFELAGRLSGSRFVLMKGQLARLHRALIQFMLDVHTEKHGYLECYVPYMVNEDIVLGTGQLPKFKADMFITKKGEEGKDLYLISTGEISLANMVRERIFLFNELPIKLTTHTPCFRSEAGSYGREVRGMLRQHQFEKVELVQVVDPKESYRVLEELLCHAENILKLLDLPYRVNVLCRGDLGFSAAKTYDLEVWLPSRKSYYEVSSCSNCETFQARRMMARWKSSTGKVGFLHTLNASGLAVGRTLVALLENYQQADGSVVVPEVLQGYLPGLKCLAR